MYMYFDIIVKQFSIPFVDTGYNSKQMQHKFRLILLRDLRGIWRVETRQFGWLAWCIYSRLIHIDTGPPGLRCAYQQFRMGVDHSFGAARVIFIGKFLTHRLSPQYNLMWFCHINIAYDDSLVTVIIKTVCQTSIHINLAKGKWINMLAKRSCIDYSVDWWVGLISLFITISIIYYLHRELLDLLYPCWASFPAKFYLELIEI